MTVTKQLIDNVNKIKTTLNEISVYNLDVKTSLELYYELAKKVNEVINELSRFEGVVSDEVVEQNKKLIYLLNEGLKIQVGFKIDELLKNGTLQDIINNQIFSDLNNNLNNFKQSVNEKIEINESTQYLFIGDSYGEGYSPDGVVTSWCDFVKNLVGISDDNYFKYVKGGYGFTGGGFLELLNNAITDIPIKNKIKYVVVGGGYNDAKTYNQIGSTMKTFMDLCKLSFPNAKIIVAPFGWCVEGLTTGVHQGQKINSLVRMVLEYQRNAVINGVNYIDGIYSTLHKNGFFSSDYVHPNQNGQYNIALAIANYLKGGTFNTNEYMIDENCFADVVWEEGITNTIQCLVSVDVKSTTLNLYSGVVTGNFNNVILNGSNILLGTVRNASIHGYYNKIYINCNGVIKTTDNKYYDVNVSFSIYQNKLYMKIVKITQDNTNFETLSFTNLTIYAPPSPITVNSLIN